MAHPHFDIGGERALCQKVWICPQDAQQDAHSAEVPSQARSVLCLFLTKGQKYLFLKITGEQ